MAAIFIDHPARVVRFDAARRLVCRPTAPRLVAIWRRDGDGVLVRSWLVERAAVSNAQDEPLQRPVAARGGGRRRDHRPSRCGRQAGWRGWTRPTALLISAPRRLTQPSSAPVKSAPRTSAASRIAPVRSAPWNWA